MHRTITAWTALIVATCTLCITAHTALAEQTDAEAPTKVCLLHLTDPGADVIGVHVRAEHIRLALDELPEDQQPDLLILRIATDGGQIAEVPLLADLVHDEFLPETRTVLWIEKARSAGALFAFACPEIVVTSDSVIGPARAHDHADPDDSALSADDLSTVVALGERLADMGGHDPALLRAMQIQEASPELLELDAQEAVDRELALGIADDLESVLELLEIEHHELVAAQAGRTLRGMRATLIEIEARMRDALVKMEEQLALVENSDSKPTRRDAVIIGQSVRVLRHYHETYPYLAVHLGVTDEFLRQSGDRFQGIFDALP